MASTGSAWGKLKIVLIVGGVLWLLGALAMISTTWNKGGGTPVNRSLGANGGFEGDYLIVDWPARKTGTDIRSFREWPALRLKIPREYVEMSMTRRDRQGELNEVAILFELPGPRPVPKNAPRSDDPESKRLGRFIMSMWGEMFEDSIVDKSIGVNPKSGQYVYVGKRHGLDQYARYDCVDKEILAGPDAEGCVQQWDGGGYVYIGSEGGEYFKIKCKGDSCWGMFSVGGRFVRVGIGSRDVESWADILPPAKRLFESFMDN
ncbi:hypothetical protein [Pseudomonas mangrovi]|uniref:hypothetical protein n=1 Tax=Pseudomonas mangrovi TaxID=2161748 RepID=UPI0011B1D06D|nr:hypothetical protein [Pseudomonas mangrovi]